MQPIDPATIQAQLPQRRGMFAGLGSALRNVNPGDVVSAFLAGMYPQYAQAYEGPMLQRQRIQGEMQAQANLQNLEFQRQLQMLPFQMQAKMYENPLAQTLLAQGIQPGTPQWNQAMATQQQNLMDPVVNAGPWGPVLRSQVQQAAQTQPPSAPVGKLTPIGGPTPSASGGF
jgi:hypothetical protein